jgi:hypothetical protein
LYAIQWVGWGIHDGMGRQHRVGFRWATIRDALVTSTVSNTAIPG